MQNPDNPCASRMFKTAIEGMDAHGADREGRSGADVRGWNDSREVFLHMRYEEDVQKYLLWSQQ